VTEKKRHTSGLLTLEKFCTTNNTDGMNRDRRGSQKDPMQGTQIYTTAYTFDETPYICVYKIEHTAIRGLGST
jgi:hypothetical protein